jgi:hypothetical protein
MDYQKVSLYNGDSRNRGVESFSDTSQGSTTKNASSLATAVSDSANGEGVEVVAGRFRADLGSESTITTG